MPAKQLTSFDHPNFARYDLRHNPGYDFLRMLDWCVKAKATTQAVSCTRFALLSLPPPDTDLRFEQ
jgi:hypothetical protein